MGGKSIVVLVSGSDIEKSLKEGFIRLGVQKPDKKIVIKPNLSSCLPYPHTVPAETVDAIIRLLRGFGRGIIIAEGSSEVETAQAFKKLGYLRVARVHGTQLIDLNRDVRIEEERAEAYRLKKLKIPRTLMNSYIISVSVLKKTSYFLSASLKNMLGAVTKVIKCHEIGLDECVVDVNLYLKPSLAVIDCRKTLMDDEVRSTNSIIVSADPVAADSIAAKLMGMEPNDVRYLTLAQEKGLGMADLRGIEVIRINC